LHLLPLAIHFDSDPVTLAGLKFPNRLGLAAGFDKNGRYVDALGSLGFGFIEIGTVTLRPQSGNRKPRVLRLRQDQSLINRMGFPNDGQEIVAKHLVQRRYRGICGVNIGKNANIPLDAATGDYIACLRALHRCADYVAINISSPNTAELRRLQHGERLRSLLNALVETRATLQRETQRLVPLFVKVSADLSDDELSDAAHSAIRCGIDGVIATNTTVMRDGLADENRNIEGGLSGPPLLARALHAVRCIRATVGCGMPIIGVGGVMSTADALAMRKAGADLVQIYTGLVYRGPALVRQIVRTLANA